LLSEVLTQQEPFVQSANDRAGVGGSGGVFGGVEKGGGFGFIIIAG